MNKVWANTKQTFKEKLGGKAVQDTSEEPELRDRTRHLLESRKYLKDIYKGLIKETKTASQAIDEGKDVARALSEYATQLQINRESGKYAAALRQSGEFSTQFYEWSNNLNAHRVNQVLVPMRDLVIGEIREARYAKKRYDKVRSSYDSAVNTVRNLEAKANANEAKLSEAKQNCEEERLRFREASYNTLDLIDETDDEAECVVIDLLIRWIEAYHDFFKQGYEMLAEVLPTMQKHRESIEEIKRDVVKKKGNRTMQRAAEFEHSGDEKVDEKTCIFGKDLTELAERDGVDYPPFLDSCFEFVDNNALDVEGIFRISAATSGVQMVIGQLNKGLPVDYAEYINEPHLVVGVLKAFFRKLPSPLLPIQVYHRIKESSRLRDNPQERLKIIQQTLVEVPTPNKVLLSSLLNCLKKISANEAVNKMGTANLAVVIAPTILYSQQDSAQMIADIPLATSAIEFMISHYTELNLPPPKNTAGPKSSSSSTKPPPSKRTEESPPPWASVPKRAADNGSNRGPALKGSTGSLIGNTSQTTTSPSPNLSASTSPAHTKPLVPAASPPTVPSAKKPAPRKPLNLSGLGSGRAVMRLEVSKAPAVPTRNVEEMQKRAAMMESKKRAQSVQIQKGKVPPDEEPPADGDIEQQETRKLAPGWSKATPKINKTKQENGGGTEKVESSSSRESDGSEQVESGSNDDYTDSDTEDPLLTDSDSDDDTELPVGSGAPKEGITIDFGD